MPPVAAGGVRIKAAIDRALAVREPSRGRRTRPPGASAREYDRSCGIRATFPNLARPTPAGGGALSAGREAGDGLRVIRVGAAESRVEKERHVIDARPRVLRLEQRGELDEREARERRDGRIDL